MSFGPFYFGVSKISETEFVLEFQIYELEAAPILFLKFFTIVMPLPPLL